MPEGNMRNALLAWFEAKTDNLHDALREVAIESAEEGERLTDLHIRTRGTAKSGKTGRIETEAMVNSVDSALVKDTDTEVVTRFGYHDAPFYTVFQELGTSRIEPMYALSDAAEEVLADLPKKLREAMKNA
jgi:hypothetical protein